MFFSRAAGRGGEAQELNYKFLQSSQEAGSPDCGCSVLRTHAPSAQLAVAAPGLTHFAGILEAAAGRPGKERLFSLDGLVNPYVVFRHDIPVCAMHVACPLIGICATYSGRECCSVYVYL